MAVLIAGGAGYIGRYLAGAISQHDEVVIVDNMSSGISSARHTETLYQVDLALPSNVKTLMQIIVSHGVTDVVHLAGRKQAAGSIGRPNFIRDNVSTTKNVVRAMAKCGLHQLVFASSAAVYGHEIYPVSESAQLKPVSAYGASKLAAEIWLRSAQPIYGLSVVALRLFNVVGHPPGMHGGVNSDALTAKLLESASTREPFMTYGTDYETYDGSCVRDFVSVADVCRAFTQAIEYARSKVGFDVINIGTGVGVSVREFVQMFSSRVGFEVKIESSPRRDGDIPFSVAVTSLAIQLLNWRAMTSQQDSVQQLADQFLEQRRNAAAL